MEAFPSVPHAVCFDTVFHQTMPAEASTYPIPRELREQGLHRYGFHGLSCESIVRQIRRAKTTMPRRMVIAHLGSGCSVTALVDGRSVDTTMGLTPTGGVVMGTRPGDLDPGLLLFLLRQQQGSNTDAISSLEDMLNHHCGLVALSGLPNDVKDMRAAAASGNADAVLALKIFTRSITRAIGGFCWLLGGLDAIVFAGGIGEHDTQTREDVLVGLSALGVMLDTDRNRAAGYADGRISVDASTTAIFIVQAQEDLMIALHTQELASQRPSP